MSEQQLPPEMIEAAFEVVHRLNPDLFDTTWPTQLEQFVSEIYLAMCAASVGKRNDNGAPPKEVFRFP